jgi:hypothetical protein
MKLPSSMLKLLLCAASLLTLTGCFLFAGFIPHPEPPGPPPRFPQLPDTKPQTVEQAVNTDATLNTNKTEPTPNIQSSTIAVMNFQVPAMGGIAGAETLIADTLAISFGRKQVKVVDRENIKKIESEQALMEKTKALSEVEKAQLIGRLAKADYICVGAATQLAVENTMIQLGRFVPDAEMDRYTKEYQAYTQKKADYDNANARYQREMAEYNRNRAMLGAMPDFSGAMAGNPMMTNPLTGQALNEPPPPQKVEEEVTRGRREKSVRTPVANIGLTVRILNVKTGGIVWVGQASKQHLNLQEGLQIVTDKLVEDFLR